jgi:cupin superfamily acireductone dioxygenase involved in methionine salvage
MNNMFLNNSNFEKLRNFFKTRLYNFKRSLQIRKVLNYYGTIKRRNMYNPSLNNNKYLTIIACHTNSNFKYNNLINTINNLSFDCNDLVIVNSTNLENNTNIENVCSEKNITYIEIDNDATYDFGKWVYALKNIDTTTYDFIVFTNDSFIIHYPIYHFYNLTSRRNVELFGYNDSTQNCYHFQSYLFSLNKNVIQKFIDIFDSKKNKIQSQYDVINEFELQMTNFFNTKDCFLKIGNEFYNKNQNIFFTNDYFQYFLFNNRLLPFTKVKRNY